MHTAVAVVFLLALSTDVSWAQGIGSSCTTSGGSPGTCVPPVSCLLNFETDNERDNSGCDAGDGSFGLCCPVRITSRFIPKFGGNYIQDIFSESLNDQSGRRMFRLVHIPIMGDSSSDGERASYSILANKLSQTIKPLPRTAARDTVSIPTISSRSVQRATETGTQDIQSRSTLENNLKNQGIFAPARTAPAAHQAFFGSSQKAIDVGKDGAAFVAASLNLRQEFSLSSRQGSSGLNTISGSGTTLNCPEIPVCDRNEKYRTADGSCNNLNNPLWGKSFTAFDRITDPSYSDGITTPRFASDGGPLPSARKISSVVSTSGDSPSGAFTHLMMQFGQFLDHDLTLLALSTASNGIRIRCCGSDLDQNPDKRHPECFQIPIPRNDPFFSRFNEDCMEFVRSAAAPPSDCKLGPRNQINQLTAFIDASMVYGSTEEEANELRDFTDGRY
ncbi:Chorion peroxidase [Nymphon striatum]|nr:Chorion peroxidase [Nymphon striatum]